MGNKKGLTAVAEETAGETTEVTEETPAGWSFIKTFISASGEYQVRKEAEQDFAVYKGQTKIASQPSLGKAKTYVEMREQLEAELGK